MRTAHIANTTTAASWLESEKTYICIVDLTPHLDRMSGTNGYASTSLTACSELYLHIPVYRLMSWFVFQ